MTDFLQVSTTVDSRAVARQISAHLIESRLAACVQVLGPIESCYRWQGVIETTEEWLCLIKTAARRFESVEAAIRQLHPYDEPEIIATPIVRGSPGYLAWLGEQIG